MLYRVFVHASGAAGEAPGGALFNPRWLQGSGRHDNPEEYGAFYASRSEVGAVAERLQGFRSRTLNDAFLLRSGHRRLSLATFSEVALEPLVNLDEPVELLRRNLRPSGVATLRRIATQRLALALFGERRAGFAWWSTLDASWTNVTLFAERALPSIALAVEPEPLSVEHPGVAAAADMLGIELETAS